MMRTMHLGSQRTLTFLLWIAFSIFVHFALTCALCHPIQAKPAQFVLENTIEAMSVEASFIPTVKAAPKVTEAVNTPEAIVIPEPIIQSLESTLTAPTAPPQPEPTTLPLSQNRPIESAPVFSSDNQIFEKQPSEGEAGAIHSLAINGAPEAAAYCAPGIARNPRPRYPTGAREMGQAGEVRLQVDIDEKGRPQAVSVLKSTGYPLLDDRARETVLKKWRFTPATHSGRLVSSRLNIIVEFVLSDIL